jgi:hypothetical protein
MGHKDVKATMIFTVACALLVAFSGILITKDTKIGPILIQCRSLLRHGRENLIAAWVSASSSLGLR